MDVPSRYTPSYSAFALHTHAACVTILFAVVQCKAWQWMCTPPHPVWLPCSTDESRVLDLRLLHISCLHILRLLALEAVTTGVGTSASFWECHGQDCKRGDCYSLCSDGAVHTCSMH